MVLPFPAPSSYEQALALTIAGRPAIVTPGVDGVDVYATHKPLPRRLLRELARKGPRYRAAFQVGVCAGIIGP